MEMREKLRFFSDIIQSCYQIHFWEYDFEGHLLETDCDRELLRAVFEKAGKLEYLYKLTERRPVCLGSIFGMLWGAVFCRDGDSDRLVVIGPVLSSEVSPETVREAAHRLLSDPRYFREFNTMLDGLPVLFLPVFQNTIIMLHYCLNGETLSPADIHYEENREQKDPSKTVKKDRRQTYMAERQLLYHVREGDLDYQKAQSRAATLSRGLGIKTKHPINQAILSTVTFTSLCTRAAIEGGLSADTAYTVGDAYIQALVGCKDLPEVSAISHRMYEDFIQRVHQARTNKSLSEAIRDCVEYIQLHPEEELTLSALSDLTGYTENYLSRKFKREVGETVSDYVEIVRIEKARMLLETTDLPIAEIASSLRYCSGTYFASSFRKRVGKLPSEYRKQSRQ